MSRLYDLIRDHRCRTVAVVGLAKNTGQAVTFKRVIGEAAPHARLLLASLGHHGERRDARMRQDNSRIEAPPQACYATVEACAGATHERKLLGSLDIRTALGELKLFRAGPAPVTIELCGLNRQGLLRDLGTDPRAEHDLFLIDGAGDRHSAAVPALADGVIVATGAALSGSAARVAATTAESVQHLLLPLCADRSPPKPSTRALLRRGDELSELGPGPWITGEIPPLLPELRPGDALHLPGAFSEQLAARLLALPAAAAFDLVIADSTRVFATPNTISRLADRGIALSVRHQITLLAVTINPFNPWGPDLDPTELEQEIRLALPTIPIFNQHPS